MRVPYIKCKSKALGKEEFGGNDVFGGCFLEFGYEGAEGGVVVFGLGGEEEGGGHDFFGVVCHGGVGQVEAFEVLYCCGLAMLVHQL